ncbi:cytochrome d ubiquinol oxidase subunit II [Sinosporangium siamense]|uniref:Cytochrome c oxidase assembly protein n=1 Tax=Sinosporangium siamense TaxID=1367973 RepID=A0A919RHK0_9ACTN|nr:cytochrome d ubiquinol oxidase subunit II [Sinosporangium siamense]GII92081.1 cytochrome c oxidase assembly protein [Sinosporangium siamense]
MILNDVWFVAIAILWIGYFLLEGFDFGVGILLPVLARDDTERRVMINTIGPLWDGNEVWLITAAGATFAAFPEWYASLFSGFYIPMLVILVALILRGLGFEYRAKHDSVLWRRRWDAALIAGSAVPAFLWGLVVANVVRGVPLGPGHHYVGTVWELLHPYALLGGFMTFAIFVTHGAVFIALKTKGSLRVRANRLAAGAGVGAAVLAVGFLAWTHFQKASPVGGVLAALAVLAWLLGLAANARRAEGWAFTGSATTIVLAVASLFVALYPDVLPSTVNPAYSLTVENASATQKTLGVMTWVAVIFLPLVLLYQSWTYWVFRRRIGVSDIPAG